MIDQTSGIGATLPSSFTYADRLPAQKLGQDEFIKILVAQLTSQDPLNPQKDSEFIGQMAQFSALESTKVMQNEIQTLRANSLLGHTVEVKTEKRGNITGEVSGVDSAEGEPKIIIDGVSYPVTDVVRVERGSFNSPATAPSTN
jgi:flagellar basal-body rod modification protein FlgD